MAKRVVKSKAGPAKRGRPRKVTPEMKELGEFGASMSLAEWGKDFSATGAGSSPLDDVKFLT